MTNLFFARHGETIWHAEDRYAGSSDVPLTPSGARQAEGLGRWAATASLDAIWSSDLSRARRTAAAAEDATGLSAHIDSRLRELSFGDSEGLTIPEMRRSIPEAVDAFDADPVAHHLPGGEDPRAAVERGMACVREISDALPDGRVLVVFHGTLMRLLLCHLVGIPLSEYRRVFPEVRNAAVTALRLDDGRAGLFGFNVPV